VRLVVDTSVLISRMLLPGSVPGRAVALAARKADILASEATIGELAEVLARSKFDRYVTREERQTFQEEFVRLVVWVPILQTIRACRDPRDDKFLELAVNGEADAILTGDVDLLAMHPFRGISIMTPAACLAEQGDK
jgi:uncharacterized protein